MRNEAANEKRSSADLREEEARPKGRREQRAGPTLRRRETDPRATGKGGRETSPGSE